MGHRLMHTQDSCAKASRKVFIQVFPTPAFATLVLPMFVCKILLNDKKKIGEAVYFSFGSTTSARLDFNIVLHDGMTIPQSACFLSNSQ